MIIIEDTRQQTGKHDLKHEMFGEQGVELYRCKIPFGDYCLPPKVSIDTKKDMQEIAGNICGKEHQRFKKECVEARKCGCKLYVLVENVNGIKFIDDVHLWVNPRSIYSPDCVQGDRLERAMKTMSARYGVTFLFCSPEESADIILKILKEESGGENGGKENRND